MTTIYLYAGPCGSGKSYFLRKFILEQGGKHLIAVPTGKLMDDFVASFHKQADQGNHYLPLILQFHSDRTGEHQTVSQAIAAAWARHSDEADLVIMVTHEAFRSSVHHKAFKRCSLWIDEVPSVRSHQTRHTPALAAHLEAHYALKVVKGLSGVKQIVSKTDLSMEAVRADDVLAGLGDLHDRVTGGKEKVFTTLKRWTDLNNNGDWVTFSRFDVSKLDHFAKVTILANDIKNTVTYRLLQEDGVNLIDQPFPSREWQHRKVVINYFAKAHVFSASALSQFAKPNLKLIEAWVHQQPWATEAGHYWMANKDVVDVSLPGHRASPVSHGLNHLDDRDACTILFRAKPSNIEKAMNRLSGITEEMVIAEREHEVVAQTAFRGSIRCPAKSDDFTITVYDWEQATVLGKFLENSYRIAPILNHVDLDGFIDRPMTRKSGPKVVVLSEAQKAERAERKRVMERKRIKAKREKARAQTVVSTCQKHAQTANEVAG
tara:strand:+ start:3805 stop:5274 length:1470 start_codon:yes stop_codon:yes gene_type:complete